MLPNYIPDLKSLSYFFMSALVLLFVGHEVVAQSQSQDSSQVGKASQETYKTCRKSALKKHRSSALTAGKALKALKQDIQKCRRAFPAVAYFTQCKKAAIRNYKGQAYLPEAIKECRRAYNRLSFKEKDPQPLRKLEKTLFFAGVDMNLPQTIDMQEDFYSLTIPNYNCQELDFILNRELKPKYLLFGNDIRHFTPLSNLSYANLVRSLGLGQSKKKQIVTNPYLGQIYFNPKQKSLLSYMPSAPCSRPVTQNSPFHSVDIHFLISPNRKVAIPYFGIAFYKADLGLTTAQLTETLKGELGTSFQHQTEKNGISYLTESPIRRYDHEGDPRDLCRYPRKHSWVAAVSQKEDQSLNYLLINRVDTLCNFGDKLASGWLKSRRDNSP